MSNDEFRHWAEIIAENAIERFGNEQVVCSGWSPSGIYHIGNSREAVTCNAINLSLQDMGADSKFVFVMDDFDPLNKIPQNLKKYSKELRPYLGHPLDHVPDVTGTYSSYAEHFAAGAKSAMDDFGFDVEYVKASDLYAEGRYDEYLDLYISNSEKVDNLFEEISGSALDSYVSAICQNCGNMKTPVIQGVEGGEISYVCTSDRMYRGCDHEGTVAIESHDWKLKWRLDWPSRQTFLNVTVEPSGKDHSVAGGSVDTALAVHREILAQKTPLLERYGFITLGGKKFSGSKGGALAADEVSDIMPSSAYLFLVYRSDLLKDIDFNPESLEYAKLLDEFDDARSMLMGVEFSGREREQAKLETAADLAMFENEKSFVPAQIKFEELALVYQTSLNNKEATLDKLESLGKFPSKKAREETARRIDLLKNWLDTLAPANIKVTFFENPPDGTEEYWNSEIISIWKNSLSSVTDATTADEFTTTLREYGEEYDVSPKHYYQPFYHMISGKGSGPNAANLVLALGKDRVLELIDEIESRI